jgi:hypothetical protein
MTRGTAPNLPMQRSPLETVSVGKYLPGLARAFIARGGTIATGVRAVAVEALRSCGARRGRRGPRSHSPIAAQTGSGVFSRLHEREANGERSIHG